MGTHHLLPAGTVSDAMVKISSFLGGTERAREDKEDKPICLRQPSVCQALGEILGDVVGKHSGCLCSLISPDYTVLHQ